MSTTTKRVAIRVLFFVTAPLWIVPAIVYVMWFDDDL